MLMSGQGYANEGNVPANESGGHVYVMRRSRAGTGGKGCTGVRVRAGPAAFGVSVRLRGIVPSAVAPGMGIVSLAAATGGCPLGSGTGALSPRQQGPAPPTPQPEGPIRVFTSPYFPVPDL